MKKFLLAALLLTVATPVFADDYRHDWRYDWRCSCRQPYQQPYPYQPYPLQQLYGYGQPYSPANRFSIGRPQTFRLQKPDGTLIEMSR